MGIVRGLGEGLVLEVGTKTGVDDGDGEETSWSKSREEWEGAGEGNAVAAEG